MLGRFYQMDKNLKLLEQLRQAEIMLENERGLNLRQKQELREHQNLSPFASFSDESGGRDILEEPCDLRTVYQRDRDRILHCKAFRRLKHKTQVFLEPEGDHYRTRLTHTLEVAQNARTIARALRLNEDLTEAIALGHDLGHTPFGHAGERALNEACRDGFEHHKQSIRVVELLEKHGEGLNLTKEVRDGILNHQTSGKPSTLEGKIVRLSDKIAYINHDIDDAIRAKMFVEEDLPERFTGILGHSVRERLNNLIHDIIGNSFEKQEIIMSPHMEEAMQGLRTWMFNNVYKNEIPKAEEGKAQQLIEMLFRYYMDNPDKLPDEYRNFMEKQGVSKERAVCDYIAGMSDSYSIVKFEELFVPKAWKAI